MTSSEWRVTSGNYKPKLVTYYSLLADSQLATQVYQLIKPLLFLLSPETAHTFTIRLFRILLVLPFGKLLVKKNYTYENERLRRELFGLTFKNPVGLAAGFDKDAKYMDAMSKLGFGFIEIGTVTPKPQVGNPRPRLFRLKKDKALINRMGFNNEGVEATVERLKKPRPAGLVVGGNIGKNKVTPNEQAEEDYVICFEALHPYVDYFVVNVSSPNTPGLRDLQDKEPLQKLLNRLQHLNQTKTQPKPILLKIAPDLSDSQLDDIVEIMQTTGIAGLIATNTTISRDGLRESPKNIKQIGNGGLSGQPVKSRATEVIRYLSQKSDGAFPIIAVGGIASGKDAQEKLDAGASLVQVYTGLVYEGPALVKRICEELVVSNSQPVGM